MREDAGVQVVAFDIWTESPAGEVATTGTATAQRSVADGGPASLVTDELLAAFQIGQVIGRYTFEVTEDRIRRFAGVLDDIDLEGVATASRDTEHDRRVAPTTFFATLDPLELKIMSHDHGLDLIPYRPTGGGNAFNEIDYVRPIRAGDVITVEVAYTDVYQRSGRNGPLVFRVRENTLTDATGERVAVARSGHVYAFDVSGYEPPDRSTSPGCSGPATMQTGEELPSLVRVPTKATLVRYAAAADDYSRAALRPHLRSLSRLRRRDRAWVLEGWVHGDDAGGLGRADMPSSSDSEPSTGGRTIRIGRSSVGAG